MTPKAHGIMEKSKSPLKKQLTYKQLVRKIVKDRKFAKKVHKLVCQARDGNKEAAKKLKTLFTLTDEDLEQCCLPAELVNMLDCGINQVLQPFKTNTTTLLLDFAAMV
jgi:hypothetical protein